MQCCTGVLCLPSHSMQPALVNVSFFSIKSSTIWLRSISDSIYIGECAWRVVGALAKYRLKSIRFLYCVRCCLFRGSRESRRRTLRKILNLFSSIPRWAKRLIGKCPAIFKLKLIAGCHQPQLPVHLQTSPTRIHAIHKYHGKVVSVAVLARCFQCFFARLSQAVRYQGKP